MLYVSVFVPAEARNKREMEREGKGEVEGERGTKKEAQNPHGVRNKTHVMKELSPNNVPQTGSFTVYHLPLFFFFPPLSTRPSLSIWLLLTSSFPSFLPLLCWQAIHQKSDSYSCSSCDIWAFTVRYGTKLISFYWKSWESYQAPRIIPVVVPLSKTPNPSKKDGRRTSK